jgi:formamidopyrimidine-DNA glycosylase
MPELAEIETVRRKIVAYLRGRKITEVILDESDRYFFAHVPPEEVVTALTGAKVLGAGRKGKYFWIELNRKPWPLFHLGMSGNITFLNPGEKKTAHQQKLEHRLWYARLFLNFSRGVEMGVVDPRRFGRMWLTDDPLTHVRIKKLGFDPLLDFPKSKQLAERLKKRKRSIKSVLLDQSLFAGIGNWLADEILFQARISPYHLASDLPMERVRQLRQTILAVTKKAVAENADYELFPEHWLFHSRWGRTKDAKTCRGKIQHDEIGGRTTAWVPDWQT